MTRIPTTQTSQWSRRELLQVAGASLAIPVELLAKPGPMVEMDRRFPYFQSTPVSYLHVQLQDSFWAPRQQVVRDTTVPWATRHWDAAGGLEAYRAQGAAYQSHIARDDMEAIKFLEAMSTVVGLKRDATIEGLIDSWAKVVIGGQGADGYLMSGFSAPTVGHPPEHWQPFPASHETYLIGHYLEAGLAHREATGSTTLYASAVRAIDDMAAALLDTRRASIGHAEIEQALTGLYGATGDTRYLRLAGWFIAQHGHPVGRISAGKAAQDHLPVEAQRTIEGHAVRAAYLFNGVTEYVGATGHAGYREAVLAVWDDMAERKMYLHGATGQTSTGFEGYKSTPYSLSPNDTYGESCAVIGNIRWAHNLFRLTGEARYLDVAERMLYNAFYASLALAGDHYFYCNRSQSLESVLRSEWHLTPCCVANIVKLFSKVGGLFYAMDAQGIFIKHYGASTAAIPFRDGVKITQRSNYPWSGQIAVQVEPKTPSAFTVRLRVPGWARSHALSVNGKTVSGEMQHGWVAIHRHWRRGDTIELQLPMPIERVTMPPQFKDYKDLVALQRGPIVYCLEESDARAVPQRYYVPAEASFTAEHHPELLGGVTVLKGSLPQTSYYSKSDPPPEPVSLIPYGVWNNRRPGVMRIWHPTAPTLSFAEILTMSYSDPLTCAS